MKKSSTKYFLTHRESRKVDVITHQLLKVFYRWWTQTIGAFFAPLKSDAVSNMIIRNLKFKWHRAIFYVLSLFVLCQCIGSSSAPQGNAQGYTGIGNPPGTAVIPFGTGSNVGKDIALHSDGRIVIVGYDDKGEGVDSVIIRNNVDGSRDRNFGDGGHIVEDSGASNQVFEEVVIQSDNKIVVAGSRANAQENSDFAVTRYLENGQRDEGFGNHGIVMIAIGFGGDFATSIALQEDGKIVVAGNYHNLAGRLALAVVRLESDGTLDQSFGDGGIKRINLWHDSVTVNEIKVLKSGKIAIGGAFKDQDSEKMVFSLIRLMPDGEPDTSFNGIGATGITTFPADSMITGVAEQSDGKIVVCGTVDEARWDKGFVTARFLDNGKIDNSFGIAMDPAFLAKHGIEGPMQTGVAIYPRLRGVARDVAIQSDGRIVVVGESGNGEGRLDFSFVRYMPDGSVDTSIGDRGLVQTAVGEAHDIPFGVAIGTDGRIVLGGVTGKSKEDENKYFAMAAYNSNGKLDNRFHLQAE